jgi:SAM-dependent methyltransferase
MRDSALAGARVLLRGNVHECPCCGGTYSRFIRRSDSLLCPGCRSLERQRTLWLYLRDEMGIETSRARVLHLAPEAPLHARLSVIPTLGYETADIEARPLVDRTIDARQLPHADGSLDLIICSHVLEHIPEDVQVASEFARVLVSGGTALIQVPVDPSRVDTYEDASIVTPEERERAFGQHDHVRVYGRDVAERLALGGLTVQLVPYAREVPAELAFRYHLPERGVAPGGDIYRGTA